MKKIFITILLILIIPLFAHAKVSVSDLYPTYKVYNSATKTISVPSKISVDNVLKTSKTIALKLKQPRIAAIGTLLAFNGLVFCGEKLYDYVQEQSVNPAIYDRDGILVKDETSETVDCPNKPAGTDCGNFDTATITQGVVACKASSGCETGWQQFSGSCGAAGGNYYGFSGVDNNACKGMVYYGTYNLVATTTTLTLPATLADILLALNNGLDKADDDAQDITETIVDQSATAYDVDNPAVAGAESLSGTKAGTDVKTEVDKALEDAENKTAADTLADEGANTTETDVVNQAEKDAANNSESDVTIAGIIAAIKKALTSFFGVMTPVDVAEPTFNDPEKSNLTSILESFTSSIRNLPVIATLNGIAISCSGSSNLCVELPAKYGGTRCYNGSNIQGTLNAIGTACLSIISLISFIYIFRG